MAMICSGLNRFPLAISGSFRSRAILSINPVQKEPVRSVASRALARVRQRQVGQRTESDTLETAAFARAISEGPGPASSRTQTEAETGCLLVPLNATRSWRAFSQGVHIGRRHVHNGHRWRTSPALGVQWGFKKLKLLEPPWMNMTPKNFGYKSL